MRAHYRDRGSLRGEARIRLYRIGGGKVLPWYPHGPLLLEEDQTVGNLITDVGLGWIADQLAAVPALAAISHMELGTDGTPPQGTNTTLGAAIAGSRLAITNPVVRLANEITWSTFWGAGVATNPAVAEVATFNALVAGDMIDRVSIGPFDKTALHVMLIERTVTFVRSE